MKFHASRRWRADFVHMPSRTLIEIEGGVFLHGGGRHSRGAGDAKDAEKYLEAVLAGWTVIRLTEKQLEIGVVERIACSSRTPPTPKLAKLSCERGPQSGRMPKWLLAVLTSLNQGMQLITKRNCQCLEVKNATSLPRNVESTCQFVMWLNRREWEFFLQF